MAHKRDGVHARRTQKARRVWETISTLRRREAPQTRESSYNTEEGKQGGDCANGTKNDRESVRDKKRRGSKERDFLSLPFLRDGGAELSVEVPGIRGGSAILEGVNTRNAGQVRKYSLKKEGGTSSRKKACENPARNTIILASRERRGTKGATRVTELGAGRENVCVVMENMPRRVGYPIPNGKNAREPQ